MTLIEGWVLTIQLQNTIRADKALDLARNRCLSDYCGFMLVLGKPEDWEVPQIMSGRIAQLAYEYNVTLAPPGNPDQPDADPGG